jgi:hypothetical protein
MTFYKIGDDLQSPDANTFYSKHIKPQLDKGNISNAVTFAIMVIGIASLVSAAHNSC